VKEGESTFKLFLILRVRTRLAIASVSGMLPVDFDFGILGVLVHLLWLRGEDGDIITQD